MIDTDKYTDFIIEHQISPSQFLFLYLVFYEKYALLYQYSKEQQEFSKEEIAEMVEKGFLVSNGKDASALYFDNYSVTNEFRHYLYSRYPEKMFKEFWDYYPNYLWRNGQRISAKDCNKNDLESYYIDLTKNDIDLHEDIITAMRWGNSRGYLNMQIVKFLEIKLYDQIINKMKNGINDLYSPQDY